MKKFFLLFLILFCTVLFLESYAKADTIVFDFTGEATKTPGIWAANGVVIGDTVTGSFSFDLALPDGNSDPDGGLYTNKVSAPVSVTVNDFTFDFPGSQIIVSNYTGFNDMLDIDFQPSPVTSGPITILEGSSRINLIDESRTVFSDDSLPTTLSVSDFNIRRGFLATDTLGTETLHFSIDSIQPVPEPTTMLLFAAGLIGLAGLGRKKFFRKG